MEGEWDRPKFDLFAVIQYLIAVYSLTPYKCSIGAAVVSENCLVRGYINSRVMTRHGIVGDNDIVVWSTPDLYRPLCQRDLAARVVEQDGHFNVSPEGLRLCVVNNLLLLW